MSQATYLINFTTCSLIIPESRVIARLLLEGADEAALDRKIRKENVLQKKSPYTARNYGRIASARLLTMGPGLWKILSEGTVECAGQCCLAGTVKYSPLFGDFLRTRLADEYRRLSESLLKHTWDQYMEGVRSSHPELSELTENTQAKLRQNAFRMLREAGFIEDTRRAKLQRVHVLPELAAYLKDQQESYVLECITVGE